MLKKLIRVCTFGDEGGGGAGGHALFATNLSLIAEAADAKGLFFKILPDRTVLDFFFLTTNIGLVVLASDIVKVTFGFQVGVNSSFVRLEFDRVAMTLFSD